MKTIRRVLIANRGEIAVRIIRACRELGIESVAVYSDPDRTALHTRLADHAYHIGPAPAAESYLQIPKLLEVAARAGADAIHPGYGFLSERAPFARAVREAGLVFVGPSPEAVEAMGDKVEARRRMLAAGVPVVPGSERPIESDSEVERLVRDIGFPVMLKAAGGGGGKGMRLVHDQAGLASALRAARSEARSAFGDDRVYVEKAIVRPRHVEVQVLGDTHGNVIHLYERECSIQRRHQKVIEESPSMAIDQKTREAMGAVAVQAAKAVDYVGAGTIEFLVDQQRNFYFLEMNTRIQVEHPVTEMVTGVDLVRAQLEIAAGKPLPIRQTDVVQRGWAIECRIYAEDPENNFLPAPGRIEVLQVPTGLGVRDDSGVYEGFEVSTFYDPILSKLIAWGATREEATQRMLRALHEYVVVGPTVNVAFHRWALQHPAFVAGDLDTGFIEREFKAALLRGDGASDEVALIGAAIAATERARSRNGGAPAGQAGPRSRWLEAGRREALRG
ncbi:MAG TPA: acetyl-CoA carboxylase biotin carboxylase subunit, partial [Candidatus Limnocylindria bacterium]|nr:acetyl-CoA carboxylase biotin carboxylase subunit [Candidatus Limnocylindria bacterium]